MRNKMGQDLCCHDPPDLHLAAPTITAQRSPGDTTERLPSPPLPPYPPPPPSPTFQELAVDQNCRKGSN